MDFLGIGPLELVFILFIALIILGPKDMVKAGRTFGRLLRNLVVSPNWRAIQQTSREIRNLPNRLMRDAGLEELKNQMPQMEQIREESGVDELANLNSELSDWTTPPTIGNQTPTTIGGDSPPPAPDTKEAHQAD